MAWETRNGRLYYYEKKRENGRVVSRYVGRGLAAQLAESVNRMLRIEREELREEARKQAALDREIDRRIRQSALVVKLMTETTLVLAGFHKHKGQWRRRRGGHKREAET
jgi:hypothetical protein